MAQGYEYVSGMDENGQLWRKWLEESKGRRVVKEIG
jgi:hypothetical protein